MGSFEKCFVNKNLETVASINNEMVEISWGGYNLLKENNIGNMKANAYV